MYSSGSSVFSFFSSRFFFFFFCPRESFGVFRRFVIIVFAFTRFLVRISRELPDTTTNIE